MAVLILKHISSSMNVDFAILCDYKRNEKHVFISDMQELIVGDARSERTRVINLLVEFKIIRGIRVQSCVSNVFRTMLVDSMDGYD